MKVLFLVIFSVFLVGCEFQSEKELNPTKEYCMMWGEWHESDGEYGWPDPENHYETECVK